MFCKQRRSWKENLSYFHRFGVPLLAMSLAAIQGAGALRSGPVVSSVLVRPAGNPTDDCDAHATPPIASISVHNELTPPQSGGPPVSEVTVNIGCKAVNGTFLRLRYYQKQLDEGEHPIPANLVLPLKADGTFDRWPKDVAFGLGEFTHKFKVKLHDDPPSRLAVTIYSCPDNTMDCDYTYSANIVVNPPGALLPRVRNGNGGGGNGQTIPVAFVPDTDLDYMMQQETSPSIELSSLPPPTSGDPIPLRLNAPRLAPMAGEAAGFSASTDAILVTCDKKHRNILAPLNPDGTLGYWPYRIKVSRSRILKLTVVMLNSVDMPSTAILYAYPANGELDTSKGGSPRCPVHIQ